MIYETIVCSADAQGNAHITPFGIRVENSLVVISPFKPSATLDNILTTGYATVNMTDDVRVFAGSLTGRRVCDIVPAEKITGFRLAETLAHQELKLVNMKDDEIRPELFLEVVHKVQHQSFKGFNRAQAAVIELAVLVSRLKRLPMEKIKQEIDYLTIAIEKTAGPRELEAWGWLIEAVTNHEAAMNNENIV